MDLFVIRELHTGLAVDASKSSHPMEVHYFPNNAYLLNYYSTVEYNKVNILYHNILTYNIYKYSVVSDFMLLVVLKSTKIL